MIWTEPHGRPPEGGDPDGGEAAPHREETAAPHREETADGQAHGSTLHHVRRAREGDDPSWASLYAKAGVEVRSRAHRRKPPPGWEADDVLQEVMLKVFRSVDSFVAEPGSSFRAWVRRIAENTILDLWEKHGAAKRPDSREVLLGDERESALHPRHQPFRDETPTSHVRRTEMEGHLQAILSKLSEDKRKVLELREEHRLSFAEIGKLMEKKEVTVRVLYQRARMQRQEMMAKIYDSSPHRRGLRTDPEEPPA